MRATDDLIDALKVKQVVKSATRGAIDLLVDILKGYEGEPTKIEDQRARMKKAAKAKATSEEEEAKAQDIHTEENEPVLGDDDLRSTKRPNITHPPPDGPHVIEDDAPNFRVTRSSKRAALLAAVEISGSCPSPQQAASRRYPLSFMCDFAGSVMDTETGELLEYRHLIKHPKFKTDWGYSFGNEVG